MFNIPPPRSRETRRAFTLIELIVVVIIIALLAAIAGVAYNQFVSNARDKAVMANAKQINTALAARSAADDQTPIEIVANHSTGSGVAAGGTDGRALLSYLGVAVDAKTTTSPWPDASVPTALEVRTGDRYACLTLGDEVGESADINLNACGEEGEDAGDGDPTEEPTEEPEHVVAPHGVSVSVASTTATVTFTPDAATAAGTTYVLTADEDAAIQVTGSTSPLKATNLTPGKSYSFTVTAKKDAEAEAVRVPTVAVPLLPPTNVDLTVFGTSGMVSFSVPAKNPAGTSYTVTGASGNMPKSGSTSPITFAGLTMGQAYSFSLQATKSGATPSTPVNLTAPASGVGQSYAWGSNQYGQWATGYGGAEPLAKLSGFGRVAQIATGGDTACAVLSTGTVQCAGSNSNGQLGNGSGSPYSTTPVTVSGITTATAVSVGGNTACALLTGGTVKCWGWNGEGELGNNNSAVLSSSTPVTVANLTGATTVSVGFSHACARLSGGTVKCWGSNDWGQLGYNPNTSKAVYNPVTMSGVTGATSVAAAANHTCALLSGGTVKCAGYNANGELGNNSTTTTYTAQTVFNLSGVTQIAAGGGTTCARQATDGVYCWGRGDYGQLGNGSTANSSTPVAAGVAGISVAVGAEHACAIQSNNVPRCWGRGDAGQLGENASVTETSPVSVKGMTSVTALALGGKTSFALIG